MRLATLPPIVLAECKRLMIEIDTADENMRVAIAAHIVKAREKRQQVLDIICTAVNACGYYPETINWDTGELQVDDPKDFQ